MFVWEPIRDLSKRAELLKKRALEKTSYYNIFLKGDLVNLTSHIPHGTMVLVLSQEKPGKDIHDPVFYQILWGEVVCWVKKEYLINPRMNADE